MPDLSSLTPRLGARAYARLGWHVFPLAGQSKMPLASRCTDGPRGHRPEECRSPRRRMGHGVYDAVARLDWVDSWWTRWPYANVGVACGDVSGIVVVDVDDLASWSDLLDCYGVDEPDTAVSVTPSGGRHLVFRLPEGEPVGNSVGRVAPGVDVRADGGYIVAAPSTLETGEYRWERLRAPAAMPSWLVALARKPAPPPAQKIVETPTLSPGEDGTPYGLRALTAEAEHLASLKDGRNTTLNQAAFRLGRLVAGGELREEAVRSSLWAAAQAAGCPPRYVRTLESGLEGGLRAGPRVAPHRAAG